MALLAPATQLAPWSFARRAICSPQFEQRGKFRLDVIESSAFRRIVAEADIGHAQARDDGQQFALGVKTLALQQCPAQARIEWQPRHASAAARDAALIIERLQFLQQAIAIIEG